MSRTTLTAEEAKALLPDADKVHAISPSRSRPMVIGADWEKASVEAAIDVAATLARIDSPDPDYYPGHPLYLEKTDGTKLLFGTG